MCGVTRVNISITHATGINDRLEKHSYTSTYYTFKALIDFPDAIASHSPGAVECPVFIVMPAICGDQARLVISLGAVYAITGSVMTLFLTSGRGELSREPALRGEFAAWV